MEDYFSIEYSVDVKPFTDYSVKLASYLMERFGIAPNMSLLEVGLGRAEILKHFNQKGVKTFALDSAPTASTYARELGSSFELRELNSTSTHLTEKSSISYFRRVLLNICMILKVTPCKP